MCKTFYLDDQLPGQIAIDSLVSNYLSEAILDLTFEFLHKFVSRLHSADAMLVVEG